MTEEDTDSAGNASTRSNVYDKYNPFISRNSSQPRILLDRAVLVPGVASDPPQRRAEFALSVRIARY